MKKRLNINPKTIIIAVLGIFLLIIAYAALSTILYQKPLEIYNVDQVEFDLSKQEIEDLEGFLWQNLQDSFGFENSKNGIIALIRPSSLQMTTEDDITSYQFLIDIDEFDATFKVSFALMGDEGFYEAPVVECPSPNLMKYPDKACKVGKTSTESVTVGQYLPHSFYLETGQMVNVTFIDEDDGDYIHVNVSSCGDQSVIDKAKQKVENWIDSLGFDHAKYNIKIPASCDGGAH